MLPADQIHNCVIIMPRALFKYNIYPDVTLCHFFEWGKGPLLSLSLSVIAKVGSSLASLCNGSLIPQRTRIPSYLRLTLSLRMSDKQTGSTTKKKLLSDGMLPVQPQPMPVKHGASPSPVAGAQRQLLRVHRAFCVLLSSHILNVMQKPAKHVGGS